MISVSEYFNSTKNVAKDIIYPYTECALAAFLNHMHARTHGRMHACMHAHTHCDFHFTEKPRGGWPWTAANLCCSIVILSKIHTDLALDLFY